MKGWECSGHWFSLSEELKERLFSTAPHTAVVLGFSSEASAARLRPRPGWLHCRVSVSWKCWLLRQALPEMDMWDWLLGYETGVGKIKRGKGRQRDRRGNWQNQPLLRFQQQERTKLLFLFVNLHPEQVLLLLKMKPSQQVIFSKLGNILQTCPPVQKNKKKIISLWLHLSVQERKHHAWSSDSGPPLSSFPLRAGQLACLSFLWSTCLSAVSRVFSHALRLHMDDISVSCDSTVFSQHL